MATIATYDALRVVTVRVGEGRRAHRLDSRRPGWTLCGLVVVSAQQTLDPDCTCGWCRYALNTRCGGEP